MKQDGLKIKKKRWNQVGKTYEDNRGLQMMEQTELTTEDNDSKS